MRILIVPAVLLVFLALSTALACGEAAGEKPSRTESSGSDSSVDAPRTASEMHLPKLGEPLPAIAGLTPSGQRIDNSTLMGKTTLVNLWFVH